mgnify:CR=1 FL=1
MKIETPSINAVPNQAIAYVDRRLTFGESVADAIAQVAALIPESQRKSGEIVVEMLKYDEPSYTGFVFPVDKYFPAWALEPEHPLVQAGLDTAKHIGLPEHAPGKWNFSTNGIDWAGKAGIPSIGFGPGEEETDPTVNASVLLDDVVNATEFYAVLPALMRARLE